MPEPELEPTRQTPELEPEQAADPLAGEEITAPVAGPEPGVTATSFEDFLNEPLADNSPEMGGLPAVEFNAETGELLETLSDEHREVVEGMLTDQYRDALWQFRYDISNLNSDHYRGEPELVRGITTTENTIFGGTLTQNSRYIILHLFEDKEQFNELATNREEMDEIRRVNPVLYQEIQQLNRDLQNPRTGDAVEARLDRYRTLAESSQPFNAFIAREGGEVQNALITRFNNQMRQQDIDIRFGAPGADGMLTIEAAPEREAPALPAEVQQAIQGLPERQAQQVTDLIEDYSTRFRQFQYDMAKIPGDNFQGPQAQALGERLRAAERNMFGNHLTQDGRHIFLNLMPDRDTFNAMVNDRERMAEFQRINPGLHRTILQVHAAVNGPQGDAEMARIQRYQQLVTASPAYQAHYLAEHRDFQTETATHFNHRMNALEIPIEFTAGALDRIEPLGITRRPE